MQTGLSILDRLIIKPLAQHKVEQVRIIMGKKKQLKKKIVQLSNELAQMGCNCDYLRDDIQDLKDKLFAVTGAANLKPKAKSLPPIANCHVCTHTNDCYPMGNVDPYKNRCEHYARHPNNVST